MKKAPDRRPVAAGAASGLRLLDFPWPMTAEASSCNPTARSADSYWVQSRQPLASLVFLLPLLAIYELGVLQLPHESARNGADAWLRMFLQWLGFSQYFLLPALMICILLGWHFTTRQSWRLSRGLLGGMAGECLLLAICLWLLAHLQGALLQTLSGPIDLDLSAATADAVRYLGAGIYEELLFRLILLSVTLWILLRAQVRPGCGMLIAVVATSLIFSEAHYVGPYGEAFLWHTFLFRFLAGVFFAILFVYRGFGIAAGTHAAYDVLAGWLG
jgi:hypothetical protein